MTNKAPMVATRKTDELEKCITKDGAIENSRAVERNKSRLGLQSQTGYRRKRQKLLQAAKRKERASKER